jgi:putative NADPH-quinone reductase
MKQKILVLDANPKSTSYCKHLADVYENVAGDFFTVKRINISSMDFNLSLDTGYDHQQLLEPCLLEFQQSVKWADHLVIVTPIWWGGIPAKLKGLFDRTFLPGFSFKYEGDDPLPLQLLKGKTSRLIITMDAPSGYAQQQSAPIIEQLDTFTLQFCGFEPAQCSFIGPIIAATPEDKENWESSIKEHAKKGL